MENQINIYCKIILPFWLEIPNKTKLEKEYHNKIYSIEIWQDIWQIDFQSNFQSASFLLQEESVISRGFLKPRNNFDDINPLDKSLENEYEEPWQYSTNKVKSIMAFKIIIPNQEDEEHIYTYIKNEKIWEDIKELVNFLLSIYMNVRLNSNFKKSSIFPLSDDYYTRRNAIFTYSSSISSEEKYLHKIYLHLKIPFHHNYFTVDCEEETLRFLQERFSRRRDLRLKLDERMLTSIEFARNSRDINLMIVNTCIYLERMCSDFLALKKNLDKSEIDILLKKKGLSYYVECQIPHFLGKNIDPQIINDTIDIVRLRNEIIHYGSDFVFDDEKEKKCDNALKLIEFQKILIEPDKEKLEFRFKGRIIGSVSDVGPNKEILVMPFESELEANYYKRNIIYLHTIPEGNFKSLFKLSDEFQPYFIPESFKAYYKMYSKDKKFITFFAINPTQNYLNFQFLDTVLNFIKNIDFEELKILFLGQIVPGGILELFKKVSSKNIEIFNIKHQKNVIRDYLFIRLFKDEKYKELFIKVMNFFDTKGEEPVSDEEVSKEIGKNDFLDLLGSYPDSFQKKIIEEKIFWVMPRRFKDFNSLTAN